MTLTDVRSDTMVECTTFKVSTSGDRIAAVTALKPCGCDGPWIGELRPVHFHDWPAWALAKPQQGSLPGRTRLWAYYPVLASDHYSVAKEPVGMEFGMCTAAKALRDWVAKRNDNPA